VSKKDLSAYLNDPYLTDFIYECAVETPDVEQPDDEAADHIWKWRTPQFEFVRRLKAHPALAELNAGEALEVVCAHLWAAVKEKGDYASVVTELSEEFAGDSYGQILYHFNPTDCTEDALSDFLYSWEHVRFALGWGPLEAAHDAARHRKTVTLIDPKSRSRYYGLFVSTAAHLQQQAGQRCIYLPTRRVSELFECNHVTIHRYRKWAEKDGFLRVTKAHRFKPGAVAEATEFHFDFSRLDKEWNELPKN
jgi:hypothetical protein